MNNYKIAETETFERKIRKLIYKPAYRKIQDYAYPILRENPFYGPQIKKLKGNYKELYRFRIGDYRLFYKVSHETGLVFILNIEMRKDAYK